MRRLALLALLVQACTPRGGGTDAALAPERMALTVNASFDHASGSYSIVDLDSMVALRDILPVSPDSVAVCAGGGLVVIQRLGWDSLVSIDGAPPFGVVAEHSVGLGSNPQDLVVLPGGDLLVTLLDRDHLVSVDPVSGDETGRVDLAWAADADGLPEACLAAAVAGRVLVALQRLDRTTTLWDPSGPGWLVVLDPASLEVVDADPLTGQPDAVILTGANPSPYGRMVERDGLVLVPETGFYGELDGGIEAVDLEALEPRGFVVTEADLGGDITDFVLVDAHLAYATVSSPSGDRLVRFDPGSGEVEAGAVLEGGGFTLLGLELTDRGELLVVDRDLEESGLDVLDAATGALVRRVHVGMAPFSVCVP